MTPLLYRCAALLLTTALVPGAPQSAREQDLKAVYLYNLAKYVDWPESVASQPVIIIGVYGKDGFAATLAETVRGHTAQDRPITVRNVVSPDAAAACHIVFIGASGATRLRPMLAALNGRPVLTVGESEEFGSAGGMIAFVRDGDKVRFDIALDSVAAAGLHIRTPLLKLARKVSGALPGQSERRPAQ